LYAFTLTFTIQNGKINLAEMCCQELLLTDLPPAQPKNNLNFREEVIMKTVSISLNSIDKVKAFVNDISKYDFDFDLVSGRYVIDAKSIMGIFSLDLSKPINLNVHAEGNNLDEVLKVLAPYIID
jgi:phosphotransferase system HPr-like phosphotransfer protein